MMLLRNGTVVDGTGAPPAAADVLVEDGRIAAVGTIEPPADARVLDCSGLTVTPGFIDVHSHADLQVVENRPEKALQGVTTEVVGNCGFSAFPAPADHAPLHDFANGILCGSGDWGWSGAAQYFEAARRGGMVRVESLVGHGTLRVSVAALRLGRMRQAELHAMADALDRALDEGACGFSTGLMYSPGASAPFEELELLCRVTARHGKMYATHMRDYSLRLPEAVDEQLALARRTGCRLQISHLQAAGRAAWNRQAAALEKIERAREQGVDVAFDCYPYVYGSTVLTQLIPQSALEGGAVGLVARLTDKDGRERLARQTAAGMFHDFRDIIVAAVASEANQALVGRNLEQIAAARGVEPVEAMFDLLVEERGAVNILEFNQSDGNLRQTLTHPLSVVVSDGYYVKGRPHPRLHGTFPELLGNYCRTKRWLELPGAIRKITAAPAERFGFTDRGRIAPGLRADITVFDAERIASRATYEDPRRQPVGVHCVMREGEFTVQPPAGPPAGRFQR
jgi:dihydroorotase/N-acyl-D-amino-acid deacylase